MIALLTTPKEAFEMFKINYQEEELFIRLDEAITDYLNLCSDLRTLNNNEIEIYITDKTPINTFHILTICYLSNNIEVLIEMKNLLESKLIHFINQGKKYKKHLKKLLTTNAELTSDVFEALSLANKYNKKKTKVTLQNIELAKSILNVLVAVKKHEND